MPMRNPDHRFTGVRGTKRPAGRLGAALLSLFVLIQPLWADEPAAQESGAMPKGPLPGHSYHGELFDEGPRQKAYLMGTCGEVTFPVSSKVPEVQEFINQGVAQLHGFWYLEAERSFRHAAMLDPDCAIAYWGMAMANTENAKRARGFIAKATERRDKAPRREQIYIDGLAAFLKKDEPKKDESKRDAADKKEEESKPDAEKGGGDKTGPEKRKDEERERRQKLADSFETVIAEFPEDLEAKAFLALHLWQCRTKNLPMPSPTAVNALLQEVIAANPKHPCHHYVIHLWDEKQAERAVKSAAMGGPSAPGIAHMWHMPGHTYSKLKRYHDAAWQQEASARVDHAHMMRDRLLPDQIHNFAHNNEWLIRNQIQNGEAAAALALAKNMIDLPRHPKWNTPDDGSAYFGRIRLYDVLQQFELWPEVLQLEPTRYLDAGPKEADEQKRSVLLATAAFRTGNVLRGCDILTQFLDRRRTLEAERDAAVAKAKEEATKAGKKPDEIDKAGRDAASKLDGKIQALDPSIHELKGYLHLACGAPADALASFERSGRADKGWIAHLQLLAGERDKAVETAKKFVADNEQEAIPLARLIETQWGAGRKDDAKGTFESLRKISTTVALEAPVFAALAPIARELGYPADWRLPLEARSDLGERPPLDSLGPAHWKPSPAPAWELLDHKNQPHSLAGYRGRPVVVVFYLGHGCLHCVEQLQKLAPLKGEFAAAGIELVAIGTDNPADLQLACKNYGSEFPFPLISNNSLDIFKIYRCYDDFEKLPLHGTFLIDADGLVRWQDISAEPFMDGKFLLKEALRLLRKESSVRSDGTAPREAERREVPAGMPAAVSRERTPA